MKLADYLNAVSDEVKGKERDSRTALKLQAVAEEYVKNQKPLTIKQAGEELGIKHANYLHQVIKANSDKVKKVKVKGRSLIVPASLE